MPHLSGDVAKIAFPKLWNSLQITFLFEHYLLELRHIAFEGKSHMCEFPVIPSCPHAKCPCVSMLTFALH